VRERPGYRPANAMVVAATVRLGRPVDVHWSDCASSIQPCAISNLKEQIPLQRAQDLAELAECFAQGRSTGKVNTRLDATSRS